MFGRLRYTSWLTVLIMTALLLLSRLIYLYLDDPLHFPVNTVKIVASYQHITRQQLARILSKYVHESFVFLPIAKLQSELMQLQWIKNVKVKRVWPGTLNIVLEERQPIAFWNTALITADGVVFDGGKAMHDASLPKLSGPSVQKDQILAQYQRFDQLLSIYGLHASELILHANQAWDLVLINGVKLHLGKQNLEQRVTRFCRAYPVVFAEKSGSPVQVDLRYPRGMAVQWL